MIIRVIRASIIENRSMTTVFKVLLSAWVNPEGIDDMSVGLGFELARKQKHADRASETKSHPGRKGFHGFCQSLNPKILRNNPQRKKILNS